MRRGFSIASGRAYPTDVVTLAIEALYRLVNNFNEIQNFI